VPSVDGWPSAGGLDTAVLRTALPSNEGLRYRRRGRRSLLLGVCLWWSGRWSALVVGSNL